MARVFTIDFLFREIDYEGLVTVCTKRNATFQVQLYSKRLHHIIPDGKLVLNIQEGVEMPEELQHPMAKELISSISDAISFHIKCVDIT